MAGSNTAAGARRAGKFNKPTRGGGKHFSRSLQPVDADGNQVSMWSTGSRNGSDKDEDQDSDSENSSEEDEDDKGAGPSKPSAADNNRDDRKALKKARKEAAIAKQKARHVEVGDLPSSDDESSDDANGGDMPANPNHSKAARNMAKGDVDEITEGVQKMGAPASRREREAVEAAAAKERYMKLQAQGKTDEAKADLARLKLIREQREAEAARRQDRLREHAKAFDGLLSLIPAKTYYGQETSEEGNQKKKKSKKEAVAARRGKLDPDSELNRNAKEVMDERANNKRKLREMQQQDDDDDGEEDEDAAGDTDHSGDSFEPVDGIEAEKPAEGLRVKKQSKKQKLQDDSEHDSTQPTEKLSRKEEKRAAKRERKAEKKAEKKKAKREEQASSATAVSESQTASLGSKTKKKNKKKQKNDNAALSEPQIRPSPSDTSDPQPTAEAPASSQENDVSKEDGGVQDASSSPSESQLQSPVFDTEEAPASTADASAEAASATTSISSTAEKSKHVKIPADTAALRARLAAKIEALRAARKADGPDGKPIRTRQELIEARRAKQAQRKAHKLELRRQAKLEEAQKREEALASNSPGVASPAGVDVGENLSFGRVVFGDGTQASRDLSYVLQKSKRKGPSDPKTALLKVQGQKKRLAELEPEKRADVTDKDTWLTARRRLEGDKIRDDEATLKKAVRRKEAAKKKSKKAWRERTQGVEQAQKERQKKREGNIQKRRDDKILGKAGKKKKKVAVGGEKKKSKAGRPGFEGSFGVGGGRKK
ncbi:hypothetical protein CP532_5376 [Ophiocordyceps camponoti-leonardi (nom. inval.)]|nr:hypothetical protein CP532_5376 [Ophiocordyceps camponoti-leonardi (nom. inval.)]